MLALLDFDDFHDLLLDATRDLLLHVRREYADRQMYAFYLFHDAPWGFMVPKMTVEGGIKSLPQLGYVIKEAINLALRSASGPKFPDWMQKQPYHIDVASSVGREYFELVNMWLLRAQFYRVTFTYKQMEQYHRTMTAISIDVLQALDKRGLFGEGEDRQQTIVNLVMMKDANREYLQHARDLNPPEVYQRWIEELDGYRS